MEFQLNYFKSYKMMLLTCCSQYGQQIWKTQQWSQDWKRSVFIPILNVMPNNIETTNTDMHASKVM